MEILFVIYLTIVLMLFMTTLSLIKEHGFIRCFLVMVFIIISFLIGSFLFINVIAFLFVKLLFMWLLIN